MRLTTKYVHIKQQFHSPDFQCRFLMVFLISIVIKSHAIFICHQPTVRPWFSSHQVLMVEAINPPASQHPGGWKGTGRILRGNPSTLKDSMNVETDQRATQHNPLNTPAINNFTICDPPAQLWGIIYICSLNHTTSIDETVFALSITTIFGFTES